MESERRLLFRQGVLLLVLSVLIGLILAAPAPHPEKWRTAHVSGLLTALLLIAFGALWRDLRSTPGQRRTALVAGLLAAWTGFANNVFAALVNFPSVVTDPGRVPDAPWQSAVFFTGVAIVVPGTLISFVLVWLGLRGQAPDRGI